MCVTIIYFLLVKLIKFFSSIIRHIASYQLWWIKIIIATNISVSSTWIVTAHRSAVVTRVFSATSVRQVDRSDRFDSYDTPQVAITDGDTN